jgi:GTPase
LNLDVRESLLVPLVKYTAKEILTSGKAEEIGEQIIFHSAELLIVDAPVTPIQQRNLEKRYKIKVLDRIGLILEIFSERASTNEGKLQVELARLSYQKSRLVKAWGHLERQRGGGGFTGGPGETQKESDRRMIEEKIKRIKKKLEESVRTRTLHRAARKKVPYPVVALAGYTNAGKSSLFNLLTKSDSFAEDLLFATLDPKLRLLLLENGDRVIMSDTVGFVSDLPVQLVDAFKATLEEVTEADLIVHVRDIASPETENQKIDVLKTLKEIGVNPAVPIIEACNKIDLLPEEISQELNVDFLRQIEKAEQQRYVGLKIPCSAHTGAGADIIKAVIAALTGKNKIERKISLPPGADHVVAALYRHAEVKNSEYTDDGSVNVTYICDSRKYGALRKEFPAYFPEA